MLRSRARECYGYAVLRYTYIRAARRVKVDDPCLSDVIAGLRYALLTAHTGYGVGYAVSLFIDACLSLFFITEIN